MVAVTRLHVSIATFGLGSAWVGLGACLGWFKLQIVPVSL